MTTGGVERGGDAGLDGCGVSFDIPDKNTADEDIDALVLFADVFGDKAAVARREAEWAELFGEKDGGT